MVKEKLVLVKKYQGKKEIKGKTYDWEYYVLNLSLYLPKDWVTNWGTKYKLKADENRGVIVIEPYHGD